MRFFYHSTSSLLSSLSLHFCSVSSHFCSLPLPCTHSTWPPPLMILVTSLQSCYASPLHLQALQLRPKACLHCLNLVLQVLLTSTLPVQLEPLDLPQARRTWHGRVPMFFTLSRSSTTTTPTSTLCCHLENWLRAIQPSNFANIPFFGRSPSWFSQVHLSSPITSRPSWGGC